MTIGGKLRSLRLKMKRTLKEQSEIFGVSLNSVYRWEHDLAVPKRGVLKKMAEYYDVQFSWLLQDGNGDEALGKNGSVNAESNDECKLLKMYRKLSENNRYKILGYVERVYVEALDESHAKIEEEESADYLN